MKNRRFIFFETRHSLLVFLNWRILAIIQIWKSTYIEEISMDNKNSKTEDEKKRENENTGKFAGTVGGALAGAQVGTVIVPVVGTVAGAIVGGVLGSEVGKKYGGSLLNKLNSKSNPQVAEKTDVTAELERLAKLHKQGVLDDDEFKAAKAALLNL